MQIAELSILVLLALYGLAVGSEVCCETNSTIFLTATTTIIKPVTTLYDFNHTSYVNISGTMTTSARSSATTLAAGTIGSSVDPDLNTSATEANSRARSTYTASAAGVNHATTINATTAFPSKADATTYSPKASNENCTSAHNFSAPIDNPTLASKYGPTTSEDLAPVQTSSQSVDTITLTSQPDVASTTTQTREITITALATMTCTIGLACPENNVPLSSSHNFSSSVVLTSSTLTRTVTVPFSLGAGQSLPTVFPLTPRPIASPVEQSANSTKLIVSTKSVNAAKVGLLNITSVVNVASANAALNSTPTYISPTLASNSPSSSYSILNNSTNMLQSTSVVTVASNSTQSPSTIIGTSTSTKLVSIATIPVTSTVTMSGSTSLTTPNGAGCKPQPPRLFGILFMLTSLFGKAAAESVSTTVYRRTTYPPQCPTTDVCITTTVNPTTYITSYPANCAYHPDDSNCMSNVQFNSAAARLRPDKPFLISAFINLFSNLKVIRADTMTTRYTTVQTITVTILRNDETATSIGHTNSTATRVQYAANSTITSSSSTGTCGNLFSCGIVAPSDSTDVVTSSTTMPEPSPLSPSGIVASNATDTSTVHSSPGSEPSVTVTITRETSTGAGKENGGMGALVLALGIAVGLL